MEKMLSDKSKRGKQTRRVTEKMTQQSNKNTRKNLK